MLDKAVTDRILDFVRQKPRTVQEVAALLERNWRTADRYLDQLAAETGLIATRTFREGTRGALKVVFWNALDRAKGSAHQERLVQKILAGRLKEDFSPFDIYQFVAPQKREALLEHMEFSGKYGMKFDELIGRTKRQLLIFSGNLSWMEYGPRMLETLLKLAKDKVSIKVLTRVDVTSQKNTEAALALNHRAGWDAVEVRHCEQPLRAIIIDDELLSIKEVLSPEQYRELQQKTFIFYRIRDPEWIGWAQKVFWHLWGQSVDARDRLTALESVRSLTGKK